MVRPRHITTDPRDPNAPIRVDDLPIDRARSNKTVAELLEQTGNAQYAALPVDAEPLELPELSPERLDELRQLRDRFIAELRERWEHDGE